MRNWVTAAVIASTLLLFAPKAQATLLVPGAPSVVPDTSPEAGSAGPSTSGTFTLPVSGLAGSWKETVFTEAGGTLDFDFSVTVNSANSDTLGSFSVTNYKGFTVSASQFSSAAGLSTGTTPISGAKLASFGTVTASWSTGLPATGNSGSSFVLILRTNATSYQPGTISFLDAGPAGPFPDYAPATPEPASLILLGGLSLGFGGAGFRRWRKGKQAA